MLIARLNKKASFSIKIENSTPCRPFFDIKLILKKYKQNIPKKEKGQREYLIAVVVEAVKTVIKLFDAFASMQKPILRLTAVHDKN